MQKNKIFDVLRRKYVALTPEEEVRQNFIHFLISEKGYPQPLLANEVELKCGEKKLRCDSLLYSLDLQPRMIVEYKAPQIELTQRIFNQILDYNSLLHVPYLIVTNGEDFICCKVTEGKYEFLKDIPQYEAL